MENLEVFLSSNGIENRIKNSGLSSIEYKMGLEEYLQYNGNGKNARHTLDLYDRHINWQKAIDKVISGLNSMIWTINGTAPLALINMFGVSYLSSKFKAIQNLNIPIEQGISGIVGISFLEFFAIKKGVKYLVRKIEDKEKNKEGKKLFRNYDSSYVKNT
ncbi:MAG: hypothetical protein V1660_01205 [archaeon]